MTHKLPIELPSLIFSFSKTLIIQSRILSKEIKKYNSFMLKDITFWYDNIYSGDFVNIMSINYLSDNDLSKFSNVCMINIRMCKNITDEGMKYLSKLHTLNIKNFEK